MKPWERWAFGVAVALVTASGSLYLWMKYVVVNDDPFAVTNHAWQGPMLALHVLTAPGLVLLFGVLLNSHIIRRIVAGAEENRASGVTSLVTFGVMAVSGHLLQVVTGEATLRALVWIHVGSGVVFAGAYVLHLLFSVRRYRGRGLRHVGRGVA